MTSGDLARPLRPGSRTRAKFVMLLLLGLVSGCARQGAVSGASNTPPASPRSPSGPPATQPSAGSAPPIEPSATIPIRRGSGMVLTDDAVWVGERGRLTRIDPQTNGITGSVEVPFQEYFFDVGFGSAWIPEFDADAVHRYDLGSGEEKAAVPVGDGPEYVAVSADGVWVSNHRGGSVSRVDPARNVVAATVDVGPEGPIGPSGVMDAAGRIWIAVPNIRTVAAIDPETNAVVAKVSVPGPACEVSHAADLVWAHSCHEEVPFLGVIEPAAGELVGTVDLGVHAGTVIEIEGAAWLAPITSSPPGSMVRIDPETLTVRDTVATPAPGAFAYTGFGSVWIPLKTRVLRLPVDAFASR